MTIKSCLEYAGGCDKMSTPNLSQSSKYQALPQKFVGWEYIDDNINYLAADSSGVWRGFATKPTATDLGDVGFWMADCTSFVEMKGFKMPHVPKELWMNSLLTRPSFDD